MLSRFAVFFVTMTMLSAILISLHAHADYKEYTVFDVRKSLPLHDGEKIYRDYYVNLGSESGVQVGSILNVYRKMPVIDIYRNKAQGDLVVPVAKVKVIHTQKTMSVARLETTSDQQNIPVVEYNAVMMGDRVEFVAAAETKGSDDAADDEDEEDTDVQAAPVPPAPEVKTQKIILKPKSKISKAPVTSLLMKPKISSVGPENKKP